MYAHLSSSQDLLQPTLRSPRPDFAALDPETVVLWHRLCLALRAEAGAVLKAQGTPTPPSGRSTQPAGSLFPARDPPSPPHRPPCDSEGSGWGGALSVGPTGPPSGPPVPQGVPCPHGPRGGGLGGGGGRLPLRLPEDGLVDQQVLGAGPGRGGGGRCGRPRGTGREEELEERLPTLSAFSDLVLALFFEQAGGRPAPDEKWGGGRGQGGRGGPEGCRDREKGGRDGMQGGGSVSNPYFLAAAPLTFSPRPDPRDSACSKLGNGTRRAGWAEGGL